MKAKNLFIILMITAMSVFQNVQAQEEPTASEQLEQLAEQMEHLSEIMDSLSEDLDTKEGSKIFEWNEDKVKINLGNDSEKLTTSKFIFSIGSTFLLDNEVSASITPDFSPLKSWSGQIGFGWLTRFGQKSRFGIEYGLVYRWTELENTDDFVISKTAAGNYEFVQNQVDYRETEFYSNYFSIPISLRINDRNNNKFSVSIGGYGGIRLNGKEELKEKMDGKKDKSRTRASFGLPDFNYGLSLGIGSESIQWYTTYELSNFFESQEIYEWNVITTGIRFSL